MLNYLETRIPIIDDVNNISPAALENLKKTGFSYLKIESEIIQQSMDTVKTRVFNFFKLPDTKKQDYVPCSTKKNWVKQNLSYGYNDRRSKAEHLETFRYIVDSEIKTPFDDCAFEINLVKRHLVDDLAIKLMKQVMHSSLPSQENLKIIDEMFDTPKTILSCVYYSPMNSSMSLNSSRRLNAHKDIDLITILFFEKPGLQVWIDGAWLDIMPKAGYAVALFGYDIDIIMKGQVRSCLHRVIMPANEDRLSILYFISSKKNYSYTLPDKAFLTEDHVYNAQHKYTKHNINDRLSVKSAFSNCSSVLNVSVFFILSIFAAKSLFMKNSAWFKYSSFQ